MIPRCNTSKADFIGIIEPIERLARKHTEIRQSIPTIEKTIDTVETTLTLPRSILGKISLYLELAKARLTALVLFTTAVGFLSAPESVFNLDLLFWTVLGTALTAGGANGLNQWWERDRDAQMTRTRKRPLPDGRLDSTHALLVALAAGTVGPLILLIFVNPLTAFLGVLNLAIYVLLYTPLKPITSINTLVGAVCGAIPPMMGWAAATGALNQGAWILGAILFVWQIPHFLSLAWMYRDDYARGGYAMLPIVEPHGRLTFRVALVYSLALLPLGAAFFLSGLGGWVYLTGSLLLGMGMVFASMRFQTVGTEIEARRLFYASLIYLPLLMALILFDGSPAIQFSMADAPPSVEIVDSTVWSRETQSLRF